MGAGGRSVECVDCKLILFRRWSSTREQEADLKISEINSLSALSSLHTSPLLFLCSYSLDTRWETRWISYASMPTTRSRWQSSLDSESSVFASIPLSRD